MVQSSNIEAIAASVDHLLLKQGVDPLLSRNLQLLREWFTQPAPGGELLCKSILYQWAANIPDLVALDDVGPPLNHEELDRAATANQYPLSTCASQLSAKLHCLYGPDIDWSEVGWRYYESKEMALHACARSRVYDRRQYHQGNMMGPFLDGSFEPDWEKLEAIQIVLTVHLHQSVDPYNADDDIVDYWDVAPFRGLQLTPHIDPERPCGKSLDMQDPYGISGTWTRVETFLERSEFGIFNIAKDDSAPNMPRPLLWDSEDWFSDGFMAHKMVLKVTGIVRGNGSNQNLPDVHFAGHAYRANSQIVRGKPLYSDVRHGKG
ncbi:MAG: hypothetical protein Q9218_005944 [Villophora microphyllina]